MKRSIPVATTHAPPHTIIEINVADATVGAHRHIDLVYLLRATSNILTAQLAELAGVRCVPVANLSRIDTPLELPALAAAASSWARIHQPARA